MRLKKLHHVVLNHPLFLLLLVIVCQLLMGCATGTRPVSFTINSEPPGGFIVLQFLQPEISDWIFIGNTPLVTVLQVDMEKVKVSRTITLKVMKQGYFDQTKVWEGKRFMNEFQQKGGVYWSPVLVPARE
jgi:hypothetical protein